MNFFTDAILQPVVTALIELTLWVALFATGKTAIGGFAREYYLAYALWTAFVARISVSWMYEFRMTEEVSSGSINGLLVRPLSFFEYYLSQMMGYKVVTTFFSLMVPLIFAWIFDLPMQLSRAPLVLLLVFYHLLLVHILSFIVSTAAFHLNRIGSLTVAKNLSMWLLSGELFPLDLLPEPYKTILIKLPFSSGVYIPVSYLTGRVPIDLVVQGFISNTVAIVFFGLIAIGMWRWGLSKYAGTGA